MFKFILVCEQDGPFEANGGEFVEFFDDIDQMDGRANVLLTDGRFGCKCHIRFAAEVKTKYEYCPFEHITKYKRVKQA